MRWWLAQVVPIVCLVVSAAVMPARSAVAADDLMTKSTIIDRLERHEEKPLTRGLILGGSQSPTVPTDTAGWLPDLRIVFAFDSADLTPEARQQLDVLAEALLDPRLASDRFELAGHTDAVGAPSYNLQLSERRALASRDYLVTPGGVPPERLVPKGFGQQQLLNPAEPHAAENRRVELLNIGR